MIAQKNRLKKADFELIFKNGNKKFNHFLNVRFLKNKLDYCRFAVIISNKISKKATERNKIKRRLKAVLKEKMPEFSDNYDLIITVLPPLKEVDFSETKDILLNLLKKSNLL